MLYEVITVWRRNSKRIVILNILTRIFKNLLLLLNIWIISTVITSYSIHYTKLYEIQDIAGGEITSDVVDIYPNKIEDFQVRLSFENAKKLIGEEIPRDIIKRILTSLEIKINNVTETGLGLTVPAYRNDVQREADIIEEILRVYGYNNIKTTDKLNASISSTSKFEDHKIV